MQSATTGFSDTESLVATLGSRLMVQVGINEVDIAKVRQGAPVTIQVDAVPGVSFPGVVTEIAPASTNAFSDNSSGSGSTSSISKFNVKIAFGKSDPRLRPGMSAAVTILSQQRQKARAGSPGGRAVPRQSGRRHRCDGPAADGKRGPSSSACATSATPRSARVCGRARRSSCRPWTGRAAP